MLDYITLVLHGECSKGQTGRHAEISPRAILPSTEVEKALECPPLPLHLETPTDATKHLSYHGSRRLSPSLSRARKSYLSLQRTRTSDLYKAHGGHWQGQGGGEGTSGGGRSECVEYWMPTHFHLPQEQTSISELTITYIFTTPSWPLPTTAGAERAPTLHSISQSSNCHRSPGRCKEQDTSGSWKDLPRHVKRIFPLWAREGFPAQTQVICRESQIKNSLYVRCSPRKTRQ